MIYVKCKECGWRTPFLKSNGNNMNLVNIDLYNLDCPGCGHGMIEVKNGFRDYQYRKRMKGYRKRTRNKGMKVVSG